MTVESGLFKSRSQPSHLLDEFEARWLRNEIPDIASYLRATSVPDVPLWHDLIEIDLEYRWRRFRGDASQTARDLHGFPQFPKLEDYAKLLDDDQRPLILTPELLAEEYRVRRSWGDRPAKEDYLERLPLDSDSVASALNQIDTEFEIERVTAIEEEESSHRSDESTWLVNKQNKPAAKPAEEIESPGQIGKYQLDSLLGRGGFGEVWKASDPDLNRSVALKIPRRDKRYSAEVIEYFRSEAQKTATLERVPGVVPVYEAGKIGGQVYIVSYLVQGEDLGKRFKRGELSYEESVRIVARVAETLHRAHLKNLFHRDVKLSNILISREGEVFLSDFGLCISEEEQLKEGHSATGTYAYMAPEQIRGQSHRLDGRADIYALGVVLYRLLTGRLPYIADSQSEYLEQVLHREPRPLRSIKDDIPAELERICLKCLSKYVKDRYTTAADLARELREAQSRDAAPTSRRKRVPLIGIISAAAGLILTVLIGAEFISGLGSGVEEQGEQTGASKVDENIPFVDPVNLIAENAAAAGDLLAQKPQKIVFDERNTFNQASWDSDQRIVHVRSNEDALLTFGKVDLRNAVLNARIESLPHTSSRFGLFWGGEEEHILDEKRVYKVHYFWILQREQFVEDKLQLKTLEFVPLDDGGFDARNRSTPKEFPFDQWETTIWKIRLHFGKQRLNSITINEQTFVVEPGLFPDKLDLSSIQVGTYSSTADFVVQKFFLEDSDSHQE